MVIVIRFILIKNHISITVDFFVFRVKYNEFCFTGVDGHFVRTEPNCDLANLSVNVVNKLGEIMARGSTEGVISKHRNKKLGYRV